MESMKSGSANHSHHPNKVAINSLETDSNKRTITSNVSGNTLNNNNKSSGNNQQEYQSTTESKDNNFEYDDNEWDVGGIGDLIKDLDNDIKKTSETDKLIAPSKNSTSERSNSRSSSSSPSSLSTPSSSSIVGNQNSPTETEKNKGKSNLISTTSINENEELKKQATATNSVTPIQANKQKHSVFVGQDKNQIPINKLITDSETIVTANNPKIIGNMSSNTAGQTTGKAGNKVSIDHQATLDKGLKMKIKRTKPGTKTSEAKHEIVKAEQNGSLSSGDDIVGKKSSLQQQNPQSSGGQQQAQQLIPNSPQIDSSTNKRQGGSLPTSAKGTHRRDKARDKTSYPQRDKTNNNMNSNNSRNGNPNNINNSDTSNSSASNSGDRAHNCHDTSSSASATTSDSNTGQSASLPSSTNMISTDSSASSSGSSVNNAYSSNTSTSGPESITKNPNAPGPPQNDPKSQQTIQSTNNVLAQSKTTIPSTTSSSQSDPLNISISNQTSNLSNGDESSPPAKKMKCEPKDMVDVCVGTSVGTITEPDCLGPCEPGTSVTLEGIVWHETEGGVLVVNVTWRGKTYVGTLLDCTRHDWAPPRFCDSPTEELDSRTPKGRAKRGRSAAQQPANDLSNFTETRSSVHSKLRNASAKGRASRSSSGTSITAASTTVTNVTTSITNTSTTATTSTMSSNLSTPTPSISPTVPRAEKRKCGLSILGSESSPPPSLNGSDSNGSNSESATMSDLNVQIPSKKVKTPCAVSPVLLECPEQDCSKKYKHANGLRYHQSHAHGSGSMDEDTQLPESPPCETNTTGLSTSALPSDSSHSFSSVQPLIQNQILNENSNMSAVSLTNQTSSINAQTPSKDSPSKGGSISMGETSPMQIQNDFSSVRHGNELSPSQSRVENENSNTMDSSAASQIAGSSNIVQTPTKGDIQGKASTPSQVGQPVSMVKTQKKQRKEGSSEFDSTQRDRDDVQSPAYSDISDDSTPVVDSEQISASSTASDHSNGKQSTNVPAPISNDFTKVKEPPLDLIAKPSTQPSEHVNSKQPAQLPPSISSDFTKVKESSLDLKFNYYPYNYMPGYPYNIDPNYGPVSMIAEDGKMSTPQPMIKEERIKENPSPNDNTKSQLPISLGKTIKTEPGKELKSHAPPGPLEGHSKDLTTSPISSYPGMFQRQSLNVPQPQPQPPPPPQLREEELRRYYGMYPDQRRSSTSSSTSSANMPQNIKEGSQSPSPSQNQRDKERNDHSQPKNLKGSHGLAQSQKQTTKETKISDEKESAKPKQDIGQKPTFESQGPPPPPTSQFYAIHPPYMGPGPFGFEPPMYRNMMVPYNSSPYHLQMSRFHAPEDLSRNTNSKALDLLQHHSAQYYNSHKIHELSERALKSPTGSQTKTVSSPISQAQNQQIQPPVSQQQSMAPTPNSMNPNVLAGGHPNIQSSNPLQPPPTSIPLSSTKNSSTTPTANMSGSAGDLSNKDGAPSERSPPPAMRHIHTHHHTHVGVGLGYPMYPAAYSAAVLTPQQAAVAVINPFPPGPNK